jgi:hypothetical protein
MTCTDCRWRGSETDSLLVPYPEMQDYPLLCFACRAKRAHNGIYDAMVSVGENFSWVKEYRDKSGRIAR